MSFERADIVKAVVAAAEDLNQTQTADERFEVEEGAVLMGDGGQLSSLALVTLILGVEEKLSDVLLRPVSLFDEDLMARPDGPFRTVGAFVDHIWSVVRKPEP